MNYQAAKEIYQNNSDKIFAKHLIEFYKCKGYRGKALVVAAAKDIEKVRKYSSSAFSEKCLCELPLPCLFVWEESEEGHAYWDERDLEF